MRRSSSTWRSSGLALALLLLVPPVASAAICLPGLYEGGQRLQPVGRPGVLWLELLLRQHEVCWRVPGRADEQRVFVFGNSGIYGFPVPSAESAVGVLNWRFDSESLPAHLFNLGFPFTYQLKDVLILNESLRYGPDLIVQGTTLDDFGQISPVDLEGFARALNDFFAANSRAVETFAAKQPLGLAEPARRWRDAQANDVRREATWRALQQSGLFVREAITELARRIRRSWFPDAPDEDVVIMDMSKYRCPKVRKRFAQSFSGWKTRNPFALLESLRKETGADVLVVAWPVAHQPREDCYNARYTEAAFRDYLSWIHAEAGRRGLRFLDLHDVAPPERFVDSLHLDARGQVLVADRIEPVLREMLRERARR